jgi:hypothetical protein
MLADTNQSATNSNRVERYYTALRNMPPSGGGGCHAALLGIANLGRLAGFSREQVAPDLAAHVHGTRKITDAEIWAAVNKGFDSLSTNSSHLNTRAAAPRPAVDGAKLLDAIVKRGAAFDESELWEKSPVRIDWPPECDGIEVLRRLYRPEHHLFIGTRFDSGAGHVLPVSEWITRFERGISIPEHIVPNPLCGKLGPTKDGKPSYRADSCVTQFRLATGEFDTMPREKQLHFWAGVPLPIVVLIDSGGKSIHGWIRINAINANEWAQRVEGRLFSLLTAVGVDGSCKNESRLSRMPGHFRKDRKRWQRLLYLNPSGWQVIS